MVYDRPNRFYNVVGSTMGLLMSTLVASSLIAASTVDIQATEKSLSWSPKAIMSTKVISDVQLSPDNESVLFVATESKMTGESGVALSRIYKNSTLDGVAVPFSTEEASSFQPRWSPDGQWIAFISNRNGARNLYVIHSSGGEARPLTKSGKDVQTFAWSPDGSRIAFVMSDEAEGEKNRKKTSLAYTYDVQTTVNRLWVIEVHSPCAKAAALTGDDFCVKNGGDFGTSNVEFDWSPDSQQIVFAYAPTAGLEHSHLEGSIATVNISTGSIMPWEKNARFEALPRYSPDGEWIAYVSDDSAEKYSINRQLAIRAANGSQHRLLAPTPNHGPLLMGPSFLGWSHDGYYLVFFEPKGTKFHICLVPFDGNPVKELETGGLFFKEPALSYDRTMLGFVVQAPGEPPEACVANLHDFEPNQVSSVNTSLLSYPKIDSEAITWKSADGMNIEGLLTYPIGYQEGRQYPLLLVIHGGPMGFFDETFLGTPNPYPLAAFAQAGFIIFRPNPRGSTGYGESFRTANYRDWGGMDFVDIIAGVDALVARGLADEERMGVMGWSYGGYMTARAITQTTRFKAASMGAGLSNLVSMNGTTDLYSFLTDYLGSFTAGSGLYEDRSPIYSVHNIFTPCLIQHGVADKRVPVAQSYEFYQALKREGKTAQLILYPGMEHRLADPKMQLDAMESNLAWFEKWLKKPA